MNGDNTGYFILYGGMALFASIIALIDWLDRRRERRQRDMKRADRAT